MVAVAPTFQPEGVPGREVVVVDRARRVEAAEGDDDRPGVAEAARDTRRAGGTGRVHQHRYSS
jgi:hypothetical protein